jgi:hypothetical protein
MPTVKSPVRWSTDAACREFNTTAQTLRKGLNAADESPGLDRCYSTSQITAAVYGDIHGERLRETKARANHWELKNGILRGDLLDRAALTRGLEHIVLACAAIIQASTLTKTEKRDFLTNLSSWPVVVEGVARKQTREAARGGKKEKEEEEAEAVEAEA